MTDPRTALKALRTYYATLTPHEYFEHLKRANPGLDLGNAQDVPERTMAVMLRVAEARDAMDALAASLATDQDLTNPATRHNLRRLAPLLHELKVALAELE